MRTVCSVEFAPLLCHISCVCSFFASLSFVEMVTGISDFWGYKVRSSKDSSACAASARVPADPVHQSTGNEASAFRVNPIAYRLTNLDPFWFFLVAGNLTLFTSFLSGFHRLQVPVQPSTLQFYSYIRSVRARASDAPHFRFSSIF